MPTTLVRLSFILLIATINLPTIVRAKDKLISSEPSKINIFNVTEKNINNDIEIPDFSSFEDNDPNESFTDDLFVDTVDENGDILPPAQILNPNKKPQQEIVIKNKENTVAKDKKLQNRDIFVDRSDNDSNGIEPARKEAEVTDIITDGVITDVIVEKQEVTEDTFKRMLLDNKIEDQDVVDKIAKSESVETDTNAIIYNTLRFHLNNFLRSFENKELVSSNNQDNISPENEKKINDSAGFSDNSGTTSSTFDNDGEYYELDDIKESSNIDNVASLPHNLKLPTKDDNNQDIDKITLSKLDYANNALKSGQTSASVIIYQEILESHPDNIQALLGLASAYNTNHQYKQSKSVFKKIINLDHNNEEAFNKLFLLISEDSPQNALIEFSKIEKITTKFAPLHEQIAMTYLKLEQPEQAEKYLKQAATLEPDNISYKYNLALTSDRIHKNQQAVELYKEIIEATSNGIQIPGSIEHVIERLEYLEKQMPEIN